MRALARCLLLAALVAPLAAAQTARPNEPPKQPEKQPAVNPGRASPPPAPGVQVTPARPQARPGRICYGDDRDDADGDAHRDAACGGDDCDDGNRQRHPGAMEFCDPSHLDEDCDPLTVANRHAFGGYVEADADLDGDGFVNARCCNRGSGRDMHCGDDCDDRRRGVHPIACEVCNHRDDDCDGDVDEGLHVAAFRDEDHDLFGAPGSTPVCPQNLGPGLVLNDYDCDDRDAAKNPWRGNCP